MLNTFNQISQKTKLSLLVGMVATIAIIISAWTGGVLGTTIVSSVVVILQLTKSSWLPESDSKNGVNFVMLLLAISLPIVDPQLRPLILPIIEPLIKMYPPLKDFMTTPTPWIIISLTFAFIINLIAALLRDNTAMEKHKTPIEKEFPERSYKQQLLDFCGVLLDDLNKIDRETNWSASEFTSLDAQVEIHTGNRIKRKITDLHRAIKSDQITRIFLVLGDPGSGKSVALRKLCRDLLKEVKKTGKVPIYINLREWETNKSWTEESPPTVEQLQEFILNNLKNRGDHLTSQFLDTYYFRMLESGRLFIVLDSFDEISAVLDVNQDSWLVDKLSDVTRKFFNGAHQSRGILSSRFYRQPTRTLDAQAILEIRPFSEEKIIKTLSRSSSFDKRLVKKLFKDRPDLVPIARNPFSATLIANYANEHNGELPPNEAVLYDSYISNRLNSKVCLQKIKDKGLTPETVIEYSTEIAEMMLSTHNMGLEATANEISTKLPGKPIPEVLNILRFSRLGRLGSGDDGRFSFAHRRFNEFFVVQHLLKNPQDMPTESIPSDSRWREVLVLFCQVAEEEEARKIAEFCWSEINATFSGVFNVNDPSYLKAIHCMRFLKDAFRSRRICISSFHDELVGLLNDQIENGRNILAQKLSLETVGILDERSIQPLIIKALKLGNEWLIETAIRSCRHLSAPSTELKISIMSYLSSIGVLEALNRRYELKFSFGLSDGFKKLKLFYTFRDIDSFFLLLAITIVLVKNITTGLVLFVATLTLLVVEYYFSVNYSIESRHNAKTKTKIISMSIIQFGDFLDRVSLMTAIRNVVFVCLLQVYIIDFKLILMVVLLIPWYKLYLSYNRARLNKSITQMIKSLSISLISGVIMLAIISAMVYLVLLLGKALPGWISAIVTFLVNKILFYISIFIMGGFILGALIQFIMGLMRISKIQYIGLTREEISKYFTNIKNSWVRMIFVRKLENIKLKPTGNWPEGILPNFANDKSSSELAKLEEKWLNVDR